MVQMLLIVTFTSSPAFVVYPFYDIFFYLRPAHEHYSFTTAFRAASVLGELPPRQFVWRQNEQGSHNGTHTVQSTKATILRNNTYNIES